MNTWVWADDKDIGVVNNEPTVRSAVDVSSAFVPAGMLDRPQRCSMKLPSSGSTGDHTRDGTHNIITDFIRYHQITSE